MYCKSCGAKMDDDAVFCSNCGANKDSIENFTYCEKCGTKITEDAAFCTECGTPIPENILENIRLLQKEKLKKEDTLRLTIYIGIIVFSIILYLIALISEH